VGPAVTVRSVARRELQRAVRVGRRHLRSRPPERREPPAIPEGWAVAPPDFVGVGTTGAATDWWMGQIERHPLVARAPGVPIATHWFDRLWADEIPVDAEAAYARWFPRPAGSIAGEWTPGYLSTFWVPSLLAQVAPKAQLIVLLADPLPRFLAAYGRAVAAKPRRWDERDAIGAFARGLHSEQLRALFDVVPRERVLMLQEEACRADPNGQLARTFRHLGLSTDSRLREAADERPPAPADPGDVVPMPIRRAVSDAYAIEVQGLAEIAPDLDLGLWTAHAG
jgi:hypothetical protein